MLRSALLLSISLSTVFALSCPQYFTSGGNGYCYQFNKGAKSFKAAAQRCASDGAHLVSVPNAYANEYIFGLTSNQPVWMGLVCPSGTKSDCAWDSGAAYTVSGYNNFGAASGDSSKTCVYMDANGFWNFDACTASKSFICELPATNYPSCYGFLQGNQFCYKPDYTLDTYADAESKCKQQCGGLAYIPDKNENDRISAGLCWECDNLPPLAKIGLTLNGSVYTWANGKPFNSNTDYSNFAFVRPSLGNCVAIALHDTTVSGKTVKRGQWVNIDCNQYGASVCQRAFGQCTQPPKIAA